MENRVIAIVGPTAVGKSALALKLASAIGGEIVNADSRQVYRHMDIGTAKPSYSDQAIVPHHLVDIVDPDQNYSLALFIEQATAVIAEVHCRGNPALLVGGTGQYVWGLLDGWLVPKVPPDPELRRRLETKASDQGQDALYAELVSVDAEAANRIDPRNIRRIIRALEVQYSSPEGKKLPRKSPPDFDAVVIGLTLDRQILYDRIDARIDSMLTEGWVDEVRRLLSMGYGADLPSFSSVGYRELTDYLKGDLSLDEAIEQTKFRTHRYARQQYTWFKLTDDRINWIDASDPEAIEEAALREISERAAPLQETT